MASSHAEDATSIAAAIRPLATKADVAALGKSIRSEMADFKQSMQEEMAKFTGSMREDMTNFKESMQKDMGDFKDSSKLSIASQLAGMESRLFWKLTAVMIAIGTLIASFT